jgi:hypothetical protein
MNVTRCGEATPISVRTRTVSAFLAGSITRARTSARNVSSPRRTASSSSVWAEPMCSMFSTRQPRLCTIWTAVAPEAVFTRRTNTPTPRGYPPRQPC